MRTNIIKAPSLLSFIFGWLQVGDETGVKAWVSEQIAADGRMLDFLNKCRSWLASGKVMHPIKRKDMANFMDFDAAEKRIRSIDADPKAADEERNLARQLLDAIQVGDEHP